MVTVTVGRLVVVDVVLTMVRLVFVLVGVGCKKAISECETRIQIVREPYSSNSNNDLSDARPEGLGGSRGHAGINIFSDPGCSGRCGRHRGRDGPFAGV